MVGEVSADTGDLQRFADRGSPYVSGLEQVLDDVQGKRSVVGSSLGSSAPADITTLALQELMAEATIGNQFVARVAEALLAYGGPGVVSIEDPTVVDAALRDAGLSNVGADLSGSDDVALANRLRHDRLTEAGLWAGADALAEDETLTEAALALLAAGASPDSIEGASPGRLLIVAGAVPDPDSAEAFDPEAVRALLGRSYPTELEQAILAGRLDPPDDALRDDLAAGIVAGIDPDELGVDAAYIPEPYRRYADIEAQIRDAEARREDADGSSWFWWDDDDELLATIDIELSILRDQLAELEDEHGFGNHGAANPFDTAVLVADATAGARWEGDFYGAEVVGYHEGLVSGGGIFGHGEGALKEPDGYRNELEHIGGRIADNPELAVAFYSGIGVGVTSDLPTILVGNDVDGDVFAQFGDGLGAASRIDGSSGPSPLGFTGAELIEHPPRDTQDGVIWYGPALLFTSGTYEDGFLVDATLAALHLAEEGEDHGLYASLGSESAGQTVVSYDGGEDPRNVLLSRVAEDADATRALFHGLGQTTGANWSGRPLPGALDPLLRPDVALAATIGPDPQTYWLDEILDSGHVASRHHPSIDDAAFPELSSDYPITSLLAMAATDDELSRWVLLDVSATVESGRTEAVVDPGTAAGLDIILANHATLLVDPAELAAVGIDQTTVNDGTRPFLGGHPGPRPVDAADVRAVYGEVLRYGRGQALATATDDLLVRAVAGAIGDDGYLDREAARPFAHLAGWTDVRAEEALFAYSAGLDDEAREANRRINTAASAGFGLLGFVPGAGVPAAVADTSWTYFFDGYPTTNELERRREERADNFESNTIDRLEIVAANAALARQVNAGDPTVQLVGPDGSIIDAAIRPVEERGAGVFEWQNPETGVWEPIPSPANETAFDALFPAPDSAHWAVVAEARGVADDYGDAQIAAFRGDEPVDGYVLDIEWIEYWLGAPQ